MSSGFTQVLDYLSLESNYRPSPSDEPIEFLKKYIRQLPPSLLENFSTVTTPKDRTAIPTIRNRRYKYAASDAPELSFESAKRTWPTVWQVRDRSGQEQEGRDEKQWVEQEFLGGHIKQHVGKLGSLLGDYAEEREAERVREVRVQAMRQQPEPDFIPEEEDSDGSEFEQELVKADAIVESPGELKNNFERLIRERFVYGLLDSIDYNAIDWNDKWDTDSLTEEEDRWFEDDDGDEDVQQHCNGVPEMEYDY